MSLSSQSTVASIKVGNLIMVNDNNNMMLMSLKEGVSFWYNNYHFKVTCADND